MVGAKGVQELLVEVVTLYVALRAAAEGSGVEAIGAGGEIGKRLIFLNPWFMLYAHQVHTQTSRVREGSVVVDPTWRVLEEIEFNRLNKLRLDVDAPETL